MVGRLPVHGQGMIALPGFAGRTVLAPARAGANILMISQASSEQHFCFVVMNDVVDHARQAIEEELAEEIARQDVDGIDVLARVSVVTTVGAGMRGTPAGAGRVFTVMGNNNINV